MPGEAIHKLGDEGARRAKRWLEATTRIRAAWVNTDPLMARKLEFEWPFGGHSFSFDIGGILSGADYEGQAFLAESKKYSSDSDQGTHYTSYLAKCYIARKFHDRQADQFMWITWHPFNVKTWRDLCSTKKIRDAVLGERLRVFGTEDEDAATQLIDEDVVADLADRLWLLVLSDKQERLVISQEHRSWIVAKQIEMGSY